MLILTSDFTAQMLQVYFVTILQKMTHKLRILIKQI